MGPRRDGPARTWSMSWTRPSIVLDRRRDWTERSRPRRRAESSVGLRRHGEMRGRTEGDGPGRGRSGPRRTVRGRGRGPGGLERVGMDRRVDLVDGSWTRPSIVLDRRRVDREASARGPRRGHRRFRNSGTFLSPRLSESNKLFSALPAVRELRAFEAANPDFQRVAGARRAERTSKFQSRSPPPRAPAVIFLSQAGTPEFRTCRSSADRGPPSGARSEDCRSQSHIFSKDSDETFSEYVKISDGPVRS
ncbi:hypothetical protein TNIN_103771 [Trichonephila inaurata madagascariensis]|uniref:Uncharacterized protein n=1 Tax=Trichonephila inaurata madagascariensis TaxID=2747483 RepID=A0A8X7CFM2_9ARAC|nr:hypothetical protein TNIN_103771 [Trichonephila inaurata madagascariensis]